MRNTYYLLITVVVILSATQCNRHNQPVGGTEQTAGTEGENIIVMNSTLVKNAGIELGSITKEQLSEDVMAKGRITVPPENNVTISSMLGGIIMDIRVIEGDFVEKGQVLCTITHPDLIDLQEQYLSALSRFGFLELEYKRQKELYEKNINAARQYQEAVTSWKESETKINALKMKLEMLGLDMQVLERGEIKNVLEIRSPIKGYVSSVNVTRGIFIEPMTPIMKVICNEKLFLELSVFEKDISKIKKGQRVEFTIPNLETVRFEAKIISITNVVEEDLRMVPVLASFINTGSILLPGMFAAGIIHTREQMVDALPEEAIVIEGNDEHYIFITHDQIGAEKITFRKIPVETGFVEDGYAQVINTESIPADAMVVVKGVYYINAEMLKSQE